MNKITKEFLKLHRVLVVNITPAYPDVFSPYFDIEFEDGRKIKQDTYGMDNDIVMNNIRKLY